MEKIVKVIGALCMCGYITALLVQFVPVNKTEKSIRLVVTLYIISVSLSPISIDYDYPKPFLPEISTVQEDSEIYFNDLLKAETEKILSDRLTEKNICYTGMDVHINKQTDKLYIDSILICGADSENIEKARAALSDVLSPDRIISGD